MNPLPESTINLLLSGLMGIIGGMLTVPINALFSWLLKRSELNYQHQLGMIAKQRELLLAHQLEMKGKITDGKNQDLLLESKFSQKLKILDDELISIKNTISKFHDNFGEVHE